MKDIESIKDFYTWCDPTEHEACKIFERIRWGNKLTCVYCQGNRVVGINNKKQPYRCKDCKKLFSVKTNTKGISSIRLAKELGVTQKTAWFVAHRIREACVEFITIKGIIEIDETFIGGKEANKHESKKLKQGRGTVGKVAVKGAISREEKQAVAYPVPSVNHDTIASFRNKHIDANSDIIADECTAYDRHTQLRVNHSKKQYADGIIHQTA